MKAFPLWPEEATTRIAGKVLHDIMQGVGLGQSRSGSTASVVSPPPLTQHTLLTAPPATACQQAVMVSVYGFLFVLFHTFHNGEIIQILNTLKVIIQTLLGVITDPTLLGSKRGSPFHELLLTIVSILEK